MFQTFKNRISLLFQGAAFGFAVIAGKSGDELAPHKRTLIPKLFRYRFDPNPHIQQAMSVIWKALVSDTRKAVS
jgi:proteasome component ECM29